MGVSKNRGKTPKSAILIGFSIINHPFWDILGYHYFWKHPDHVAHSVKVGGWLLWEFTADSLQETPSVVLLGKQAARS